MVTNAFQSCNGDHIFGFNDLYGNVPFDCSRLSVLEKSKKVLPARLRGAADDNVHRLYRLTGKDGDKK